MKTKMRISLTAIYLLIISSGYSQVTAVGNATVIPYRFFGWDGTGAGGHKTLNIKNNWIQPINIFTNNKFFAQFTVNNGLGAGIPGNNANSLGDGLSILNQSGGSGGGMDLWCDANTIGSNGTHIKFDGSWLRHGIN